MSFIPDFKLLHYSIHEGLDELNKQLRLVDPRLADITLRDLLNMEGRLRFESPSGEPCFYVSFDEEAGESLYSAIRWYIESNDLPFNSIGSVVSESIVTKGEMLKAFNLLAPSKAGKIYTTRAQARFMVSLLKALGCTDDELKGSVPDLIKKLAAAGVDVSVTDKPFREWLEKGGAR